MYLGIHRSQLYGSCRSAYLSFRVKLKQLPNPIWFQSEEKWENCPNLLCQLYTYIISALCIISLNRNFQVFKLDCPIDFQCHSIILPHLTNEIPLQGRGISFIDLILLAGLLLLVWQQQWHWYFGKSDTHTEGDNLSSTSRLLEVPAEPLPLREF